MAVFVSHKSDDVAAYKVFAWLLREVTLSTATHQRCLQDVLSPIS
jgi:hypothetical protein